METKTRVPKIERNWQIKDRTYVLTGGKARKVYAKQWAQIQKYRKKKMLSVQEY